MTTPPSPVPMACAVCGLVVDAVTFDDQTVAYQHTLASADDHPVVPVPVEEVRTNFRCDFCLADETRWALPVEPFEMAPGSYTGDDWAACDDCAMALRTNDWNKIIYRAMKAHRDRRGVPVDRIVFVELYRRLRSHITGPVRLRTA